jgi:signal transduction histidine kinase
MFLGFERRKRSRTGLGLGLSISRKSVRADGGEIRVRDMPGIGCVFTIVLPRLSPAGSGGTPEGTVKSPIPETQDARP